MQLYKKKVEIGDCTLYLGDCLDVMPTLGKVDAVVTDPPYGIGEANGKNKSRSKLAKSNDYGKKDWDNEPCSDDKLQLMQEISKNQIIFGGNYFELPPTSCWLVWDKENGGADFADCELAWTNLKKAVRLKKHMWNGMLRKGQEERWGHPTQKPLEVMSWCISHLPDNAETILDPFMGSGTTGVACVKLGRSFIGIELDEEYFEIACERIRQAYAQPDMFVEQTKEPEQGSLL
jgi:DNA modification methylase